MDESFLARKREFFVKTDMMFINALIKIQMPVSHEIPKIRNILTSKTGEYVVDRISDSIQVP